jgi:hypothetical protein
VTVPRGPSPDGAARWWRREGRAFAELFALCGFAIAQPLLDVFGRNPTQFVFRDADTIDIIGFALVITLFVPVVLWSIEASVGRLAPRSRRVVHLAFVAGLVGAFVMQAARGLVTRVALSPPRSCAIAPR